MPDPTATNFTPTMASATIKQYMYQQYADDNDLQTFVAAENAGTQNYIDWFNQVILPVYQNLSSGPPDIFGNATPGLLDWVAAGLYGLTRTAVEAQRFFGAGPLNTVVVNAILDNANGTVFGYPFNVLNLPSTVFFAITDDVFKRVMTWNIYKGDGKRFCFRWLKRRVMRFLVGVNGWDSTLWYPAHYQGIGCDNTTAISVRIAGNTLIVSIDQGRLAQLGITLTPGIAILFQAIFQSPGILDLPADFTTYICTI